MKILKGFLGLVLLVLAVVWVGRSFLASLGNVPAPSQPAAVVHSAPPEFSVEELGATTPREAAQALRARLDRHPDVRRLGVHFTHQGTDRYWLVDLDEGKIEERAASGGKTRTRTSWYGGLEKRLAWGVEHGTFSEPGSARPESENLYH